jgi:hypothetical protein
LPKLGEGLTVYVREHYFYKEDNLFIGKLIGAIPSLNFTQTNLLYNAFNPLLDRTQVISKIINSPKSSSANAGQIDVTFRQDPFYIQV